MRWKPKCSWIARKGPLKRLYRSSRFCRCNILSASARSQ
jgi:hypothetical protein